MSAVNESPPSEFDIVYAEAFQSVVPNIDAAFVQEALDTTGVASIYDAGDGKLYDMHISEAWLMEHPAGKIVETEDMRRLRLVRTLGAVILAVARDNLLANPNLLSLTDTIDELKSQDVENLDPEQHDILMTRFMTTLHDVFQSGYWYRHAAAKQATTIDAVFAASTDEDPELASPQRVKDWPRGERLNCLGVAIGMSAAAEAAGVPYVFANEIQESDTFLARKHKQMIDLIKKLRPGIETSPTARAIADIVAASELYTTFNYPNFEDEIEPVDYKNYLYTPATFGDIGLRNQFHHFIMLECDNAGWQIDPYALTLDNVTLLQELPTPRSIADVTNVKRTGDYASYFFVPAVRRIQSTPGLIKKYLGYIKNSDKYKTSGFLDTIDENLLALFKEQFITFLHDIDPDGIEDSAESNANIMSRNEADVYLLAVYTQMVAQFPQAFSELSHNFINANTEISTKYTSLSPAEIAKLEKESRSTQTMFDTELRRLLGYSTEARYALFNLLSEAVYVHAAETYSRDLNRAFRLQSTGFSNLAAEFGNPQLMIGAMYLNHFATWRKDGKVNIARYLARLIPSQLLWQAAMQDGEIDDERVNSLGEQVESLPDDRVHPLVEVARYIYYR